MVTRGDCTVPAITMGMAASPTTKDRQNLFSISAKRFTNKISRDAVLQGISFLGGNVSQRSPSLEVQVKVFAIQLNIVIKNFPIGKAKSCQDLFKLECLGLPSKLKYLCQNILALNSTVTYTQIPFTLNRPADFRVPLKPLP